MKVIKTKPFAVDRHRLPTTIETEGFQLVSLKIDEQGITKLLWREGKSTESHFSFANIQKIVQTQDYYAVVTRLKHTEVAIPYRAFRWGDRARFEKLLKEKQVYMDQLEVAKRRSLYISGEAERVILAVIVLIVAAFMGYVNFFVEEPKTSYKILQEHLNTHEQYQATVDVNGMPQFLTIRLSEFASPDQIVQEEYQEIIADISDEVIEVFQEGKEAAPETVAIMLMEDLPERGSGSTTYINYRDAERYHEGNLTFEEFVLTWDQF